MVDRGIEPVTSAMPSRFIGVRRPAQTLEKVGMTCTFASRRLSTFRVLIRPLAAWPRPKGRAAVKSQAPIAELRHRYLSQPASKWLHVSSSTMAAAIVRNGAYRSFQSRRCKPIAPTREG
jgi:hypothetical protein